MENEIAKTGRVGQAAISEEEIPRQNAQTMWMHCGQSMPGILQEQQSTQYEADG
jgi:hypothetical protein